MVWVGLAAAVVICGCFTYYQLLAKRQKANPSTYAVAKARSREATTDNQATSTATEAQKPAHRPEKKQKPTPANKTDAKPVTPSVLVFSEEVPSSTHPPQPNGHAIEPANRTTTVPSMMEPPRLKPPTFSSMPPPPRPTNGSALRPPPSAASMLRVPPTKVLSNTSMAPSSTTVATKKSSRQVMLAPGHSPLDWAQLTSKPNHKLRGKDVPDNFIRVPPSLLKYHNGRKGRDAWTEYQGKVYNITPYLPFHPGGEGELMRGAGKDSAKLFMEVHPWVNWEGMLAECLVGVLVSEKEVVELPTGDGNNLEEMD